MAESSFLDWPFFDAGHRELAEALDVWASTFLDEAHGADEYAATRALGWQLAEGGWLRYCVPAAHGGVHERIDVRALCLIRETLARFSGLADFAFAMQGLGSGPISFFGSAQQRAAYLPAVARGEKIAAFALSERQAGSDVAAIATTATRDGDHYVLDGSKTWISNAGLADFYVVFARTGEGPGARGLSAFVVDADASGLAVTEKISVIAPHPLGTLAFEGCRVPGSALLGEPGQGFKIALATLDVFRATVGAAALGLARRAMAETLRHTRRRHVFGQALSEFQMTQDRLADMAMEIDASALLVYRAAWRKDSGAARVTLEAAMAKAYATEAAQRVIDRAVQLFGGLGVTAGSVVERLYRDVRPLRIYEGATEIQKIIIAGQLLKQSEDGG